MSQIGKLSVKIDANTTGFKKGIKDVQRSLGQVGTRLRESVNTFAKWGAGIATAATTAGVAIVQANLKSIRELNNLSMAANVSVADFQRMAFAAQQYGIEQQELGDILKDMNDRVGDFIQTGGGPMVDFFEKVAPKVGLTAQSFRNLNGKDALQLYVDSLEAANLNQEDMVFYMEALSSKSTQLLPLLTKNGEEMGKMAEEAEALGIGMRDIDVQNALEAQKAIDSVTSTLKNETMEAVAEMAPLIEVLVEDFQALMQSSGNFSITAVEGLSKVAKAFAWVGNIIQGWKAIFAGLKIAGLGFTSLITVALRDLMALVNSFGNSLLGGLQSTLREMAQIASHVSDDMAGMFNSMADGIDGMKAKVPDVVRDLADSQLQALALAKEELAAIAATPLPTDNVDQWVEEIKARMAVIQEAREKALGQKKEEEGEKNKPPEITVGGEVPGDKLAKLQENLQTETEMILEQMGIRYEMEEALQLRHLEIELQQLQNKKDQGIALTEEEIRKEAELRKKQRALTKALTWKGIGETLNAVAGGSKKLQKLQQAYALANAGIAISAGIARAQELGFPANIAEMARVIAVGVKSIQGIKSKKPPSVAGAGAATTPSLPTPSAPQPLAPQMNQRRIDINIVGEGLMSTDQVRDLIGQINEETGNGVALATGG